MIVTGRRNRRDYMPHGPFLALGAIIALFWGADIWKVYAGVGDQAAMGIAFAGRFYAHYYVQLLPGASAEY